jgi:hypothetical protein
MNELATGEVVISAIIIHSRGKTALYNTWYTALSLTAPTKTQ